MYKQKVKHLLYEHQNNITTLKADGEMALKLQQDEFRKHEGDLTCVGAPRALAGSKCQGPISVLVSFCCHRFGRSVGGKP